MSRGIAIAAVVAGIIVLGALMGWSSANDVSTPFPVGSLRHAYCGHPPDEIIDADLRVVVHRGEGVSEREVRRQLEGLAAYFEPYQLRLSQLGPTRALGERSLLSGSRGDLDRALSRAGIDPTRPATGEQAAEARRLACQVTTAPLRAFVDRQPRDGARINLVILRSVAKPGSAIAQLLPNLRGLTLSPNADLHPELRACLDLGETFSPTIMLGLDAIEARRPGRLDVTLVHELAHVLGLEQNADRDDIMFPEPPSCLPTLSARQVVTMRQTTRAMGHTPSSNIRRGS